MSARSHSPARQNQERGLAALFFFMIAAGSSRRVGCRELIHPAHKLADKLVVILGPAIRRWRGVLAQHLIQRAQRSRQ